jgi:hypothetical protein
MTKKDINIFYTSILGILVAVLVLYLYKHIDVAQAIQILLTFTLVSATIIYVRRTAEIAKASKEQAEASVKMARNMVKPRLMPHFQLMGDFLEDRYVRFKAVVYNDGNGPAYDIELHIEDDSNPPNVFTTGTYISVIREHQHYLWAEPTLKIHLPQSDSVLRQYLVTKYKDIDGEYEVRLPIVLRTGKNEKPFTEEERPTKILLRKTNLEDELP